MTETEENSLRDEDLTARAEPFDSFWEAPDDVGKGYDTFATFYRYNYLERLPSDRDAKILVISCGYGYLVQLLADEGYREVTGIDSRHEKVAMARERGLNCRVDRALRHLRGSDESYDVIVAEQEINHLTKNEILVFLAAARDALRPGGRILVHSINAADPLTGSESRAGNFDHFNSFTEYSLVQALKLGGFERIEVFPLDLYVFWKNPLNYPAFLFHQLYSLYLRLRFAAVGKSARIFTKKIGAIGYRAPER